MADEETTPQAVNETDATPAEPQAGEATNEETKKADDVDDLGIDLEELFSDDDEVSDEALHLLAQDLPDVQISDLLSQVRELQSLIRRPGG